MSGYRLTDLALADLENILQYSIENWGVGVAKRYYRGLYERFEWLVDNTKLGKYRPEIDLGIYSYQYKSHLIFYEIHLQQIEILRILHKSTDYQQHLQ